MKKTQHSFSKTIALLLPSLVSICIFISIFLKFTFKEKSIEVLSHTITDNNVSIEAIANQLYQLIENNMYDSVGLIIGIIGIAVSVWIGLNIYNAIEKKDIENIIGEITEQFEKRSLEIDQKVNYRLREIEKEHRILYLTTMLKQRPEDSSTRYYIEYVQSKLPDYDLKTINVIIEMETLLSAYDGSFSSSGLVVSTNELKGIRNKYVLLKQELIQSSEDKIMLSYYHYKLGGVYCRIADAMFRDKQKKLLTEKMFYNAISEYEQAGELDSNFLSVDNGIGFSYLRLSQLKNNQMLGEKAIQYLKLACETNPRFEKAIRNLGCAYEICFELDKAIEQYKKAMTLFPDSDLVHSCLASAYLKKIDEKTHFFIRSRLFDKECFQFKTEEMNKIDFYLKKAKWHADYVIKLRPDRINGYYRLIEYYSFYILTKRKNNCSYAKHENEIKELICYCEVIDPSNNAYKCHLRNYYEVIGDVRKAKRINNTLEDGRIDIY